jgi:Uma2 family endonuclease
MEEMATLPQAKTVTYEEWLAMPEPRDAREEIVNGEIRLMPPPKALHGLIIDNLFFLLRSQVDPREIRVRASTFGILIRKNPPTARIPDLAVFLAGAEVEEDGLILSAPQLAVEVLSPANTRRERQEKLDDYASIGIPEVWVISPEGRTVELLILESGQLVRAGLFGNGDILKPRLFPHVQIDIAQIWPD